MGVGANVFLVGLVGVGYYVYTSIDSTRVDYPSPVNELYRRVAALPAIPYGVQTMWVVEMKQFGIQTSSEVDKVVTWTFTYKGQKFGTYTVNFLTNGDKSTTVYCKLEAFEPDVEGSLMENSDWDVLRGIARDVTYEQVRAALSNGVPNVGHIRKHQGRILLNLTTVTRLQKMNESDVGAVLQAAKDGLDDATAAAQANAEINGAGSVGSAERGGDVGGESMEQ